MLSIFQNKNNFLFLLILLSIGGFGCQKQLRLEPQEPFGQSSLVFSGGLIGPNGPHRIKASTSGDGQVQAISPFTQLEITLFKDGQAIKIFQETKPGEYTIPFGALSISAGEVYHIEAQLISGETIRSSPFIVPEDIQGVSQIKKVSTIGRTPSTHAFNVQGDLIEIYTDFTPDAALENGYIHYYQEDEAYLIEDKVCHPLDPSTSCFFKLTDPESQNLRLLDLSVIQNQQIKDFRLVTQPVDFSFEFRHGFLFKQQIINEEYYNYLKDLEKIIQNDNDIFGTIPGNADSNLFSLDDPSRRIFGMVTAVFENELPVIVTPFDLPGVFIQGYCDFINSQERNQECCNCGLINGAILDRPYWF